MADQDDPSTFAYVPPGASQAFGQKPVRRLSPMFSPDMRATIRDKALEQGGGAIDPMAGSKPGS
jgi:hypothetical protein